MFSMTITVIFVSSLVETAHDVTLFWYNESIFPFFQCLGTYSVAQILFQIAESGPIAVPLWKWKCWQNRLFLLQCNSLF